ncbi:Vestitone reductase [Actinidia chinensis var. chinensis]|uniref:Dihydroflavonol 4-reductase n=1 Tax=Actinidia chinensis var. chinensis TaxID=1590841 RepID=A0A2R6RCR7_ACTCC|nr:Vestitone reductase [Actinidia chinensis var. chinensis]
MEEDEDKGIVLVTGGTGYVASWLITRLLQQGYRVRTTIRSYPDSKKDISYLTNLPGAPEKLEIFNADLNDPESFNGVIPGCTGVFHVAHPVGFEEKVPEQVTNERSVKGTIGILQACLDSKTVKRVVYTSSAFTVMYNDKSSGLIDDSDWTDVDYVRALKPFGASYIISKTLAERAALEFAEAHGLELVSLIPPWIIGPFICSRCPSSVYPALAMILGEEDQYKHLSKTSMVHVDDVAIAHIFLLEHPDLKGRYICSPLEVTIDQISEFLSAKYPEYPVPRADALKGIEESKSRGLSSKKLVDSGFEFKYGFEEMFDGAIQCCKEKGLI